MNIPSLLSKGILDARARKIFDLLLSHQILIVHALALVWLVMIVGRGYRSIAIIYLYGSSKLQFGALFCILKWCHL